MRTVVLCLFLWTLGCTGYGYPDYDPEPGVQGPGPNVPVIPEEPPVSTAPDGGIVRSFEAVSDTRLEQKAPSTNYANAPILWGSGKSEDIVGQLAEAAVRFDVSALPVGSTVLSARLRFFPVDGTAERFELFSLERDWTENAATWLLSASGQQWSAAGANGTGDRSETPVGSLSAAPAQTWTSADVDAALVQRWVTTPAQSRGLLLRPPPGATTLDSLSFESSENVHRPSLEVTFVPPEGCEPVSCGAQNCGTKENGCGTRLACGTCAAPETCGGAGTPNVCGAPEEPEEPEPRTFRYMVMNLHHGRGTDNVYSPARQAGVAQRDQPDAICFNEADGSLPDDLPPLFGGLTNSTWHRAINTRSDDMILSRHRIVDSATMTFSRSVCGTYGAVRATLDLGDREVEVICTHLDVAWGGCSGDLVGSRARQVNELKHWVAAITRTKVIAGDMNAGYSSSELGNFAASTDGSYQNAWIHAVRDRTATAYPDNLPRNDTRTRKGDLDHIYFLGAGVRVVSAKVPDVRDFTKPVGQVRVFLDSTRRCPNYAAGEYGFPEDCFVRSSDHQPKVVTLELP